MHKNGRSNSWQAEALPYRKACTCSRSLMASARSATFCKSGSGSAVWRSGILEASPRFVRC
jgi:hypothetical protein